MEYCRFCLQRFSTTYKGKTAEQKLQEHLDIGCRQVSDVKPIMPTEEEKILEFTNVEKQYRAPFVIYADFESLTESIDTVGRNPGNSYTEAYQQHTACGYCIHIVCSDKSRTYKPIVYRGKDTIPHFIKQMHKLEESIMADLKLVEPMVMTEADFASHANATECCLCHKPFEADTQIVREHCHLTGKYRGAACSHCNLKEGNKRTRRYKIPVFFHNLKGYDSHLIISEVGKYTENLQAIPQNYEKMISFGYGHLRFLDSLAFLSSSLDTQVENLYEKGVGKDKFVHSARHCSHLQHLDLMMKKGVYPYYYMNSWAKMDETALPPKEAFFSKLSDTHIQDEQYAHAQQVWESFECKTMGDYHDLYMKSDVLLLADVFENFRDVCMEYYGLDPAHYFTTPNFAWDAMMKKTGVQLELLTDYNMHMMIEQGIRGGIAMISHRHAEANNPYLAEGYDKSKEHSYIAYLDANNLYGWAMTQPLPYADFQWSEERDMEVLLRYAHCQETGCIVMVDLDYPEELHDLHNDYPLAPEQKLVENAMLSPYAAELKQQLNIGDDVCQKLVPNLMSKSKYVVDIRNLAMYVRLGMKVTRVHRVITFAQKPWLKSYIDFNTDKRKVAKNEFEKAFFKLMNNSCFGKTMENLRGRVDINFVTSNSEYGGLCPKHDRTVERHLASPLYDGHIIFSNDLTAIKQKKKSLVLNKPIYAGMCILDLSKYWMYQFHYDVIKEQYGNRAKLLFTDTDSLCYHIRTEDYYKEMRTDEYDLSDYPEDSVFHSTANKKVLGKFKDECNGKAPAEFVGLRPKMYSLRIHEEKDKKTAKGVQRAYMKNKITHADYRRCLLSEETADKQQYAKWCAIRSYKHQVKSIELNKVGLCAYDNKRYLLTDGVQSYAYGHLQIH